MVNVGLYEGKVVSRHCWGTWCAPCVAELPHFDELAEHYGDDIAVIAVHTVDQREKAESFVEENYPDSDITFVYDTEQDGSQSDMYYSILGGKGSYPMTVVLDKNGIIQYVSEGSMTYMELEFIVESFLYE